MKLKWHDLLLKPINLWSLPMSSNSITGDSLVSKIGSKEQKEKFDEGFDRIFRKKPKYSEDWQDSERDKAIAQNGNTGEHYENSN
jgi:hypothetical protein